MDLEVLDRDPLGVERADDVGELGAALVEAHGDAPAVGALRGAEPRQHLAHPLDLASSPGAASTVAARSRP